MTTRVTNPLEIATSSQNELKEQHGTPGAVADWAPDPADRTGLGTASRPADSRRAAPVVPRASQRTVPSKQRTAHDVESVGKEVAMEVASAFSPFAVEPEQDFVSWPCGRPLTIAILFLLAMLPFLQQPGWAHQYCHLVASENSRQCQLPKHMVNLRVCLAVLSLVCWAAVIIHGLGLTPLLDDKPTAVAPWFSLFFVCSCVWTVVVTAVISVATACVYPGNSTEISCEHGSRSLEWATVPAFGSLLAHAMFMVFRVSTPSRAFKRWASFMASSCPSPMDATDMLETAREEYKRASSVYANSWLTDQWSATRRRSWAVGPFTPGAVLFGILFDLGVLVLVSTSADNIVNGKSMWVNVVHSDPLGHRVVFWLGMAVCAVNNYALVRYLLGSSVASVFGLKAALDTVVNPALNPALCRMSPTAPMTVKDVQTWLTGRRMVIVWVKQVIFPRFSRVIVVVLLAAATTAAMTIKGYFETRGSGTSAAKALDILLGKFGVVEMIAYFIVLAIIAIVILFACTTVWKAMTQQHSIMNVVAVSPNVTPEASKLLGTVMQLFHTTDSAPTVAAVPADMKLLVGTTVTLLTSVLSVAGEHLAKKSK